ncbi:MAG: DUF3108 domain-containing protein [Candidatus Cloacimonadia bacterium]
MKSKLLSLIFCLCLFSSISSPEEKAKFDIQITYLGMPVAEGEIVYTMDDSLCQINAYATSKGIISALYYIDNKYISICDSHLLPKQYKKYIVQDDFEERKVIVFDQNRRIAQINNKLQNTLIKVPIAPNTRDLFSTLFAASKQIPMENFSFSCFADYNIWEVTFTYHNRENVRIKDKTFPCLKYSAEYRKIIDNNIDSRTDILTNNIFNNEGKMFFWFSEDLPYLPVIIQYKMFPFSVFWKMVEMERP